MVVVCCFVGGGFDDDDNTAKSVNMDDIVLQKIVSLVEVVFCRRCRFINDTTKSLLLIIDDNNNEIVDVVEEGN